MSLTSVLSRLLIYKRGNVRQISVLRGLWQQENPNIDNDIAFGELQQSEKTESDILPVEREEVLPELDPNDRSGAISVFTSIQYMQSKAFQETYKGERVWKFYRRNKTHHFLSDTRKTCIRGDKISTGSPCPICRDKYLVVDYRNVELLKHFISPYTHQLYPTKCTGVCQMQYKNLQIAYMKAKDYGLIPYCVPFRHYNYYEYKKMFNVNV